MTSGCNWNPHSTSFLIDFVVPAILQVANTFEFSDLIEPEIMDESELDVYYSIRTDEPMDNDWFYEVDNIATDFTPTADTDSNFYSDFDVIDLNE